MNVLVVEDQEHRIKSFLFNLIGCNAEIVTTSKEAINALQVANWDCLLLDHDLEGAVYCPSGPGTGYEVACWLEQHPDKKPKVIITHSLNTTGADNICRALPEAFRFPHCWELAALKDVLVALLNHE